MDYNFIFPLYEENEIDEASKYMADIVLYDAPSEAYKFLVNSITASIKDVYGVNTPMMANYNMVHRTYEKKYKKHIFEYFKLFDIDVIEYRFDLSSLVIPMSNRLTPLERSSLLRSNFPSNEKWDYNKNYGKAELINPMIGLQNVWLQLHNISRDHEEFANKLSSMYIENGLADNIKTLSEDKNHEDKREYLDMFIHILPSTNYRSINALLQLAHKYL